MVIDNFNQGESAERPEYLPRSHPGKVFRRRVLKKIKLTRKEIAARLGISQDHLAQFVNGQMPVTIELARKLEAEFLISAAAWMNYQKAYDSYRAACDNK